MGGSKSDVRQPELHKLPYLRFLGKQAGLSEDLLNSRLRDLFRMDDRVKRAYLARVAYPELEEVGVALCLQTRSGPDETLVREVGDIFASVFDVKEHLDIIFLDRSQEDQLSRVCDPFYRND